MNPIKSVMSIIAVVSFCGVTGFNQNAGAQSADWKIKKIAWTDSDEKEYSEFVSKIGDAVERRECNSFQSCLSSKSNPYRGSDSGKLQVFADCAKLSYLMRGYFAWKKGLPFSVADDVELRNVPGNSGDKRYSSLGNAVTSRINFLPSSSAGTIKFVNAINALNNTIVDAVYSANFRLNFEGDDDNKLFSDFYPVELTRDGIAPGTNIYDPNGHVAIVYKVTDDGRIYFIDAHPDNSLTSGLYGTKFVRSNPVQGAGFKNFRPIHLEGAQYNDQAGSYVGGTIIPAKDKDLQLHSLVQFFGTNLAMADWKKGVFQIEGKTLPYYDYLRTKMSKGNLKLDPVSEIKSLSEDLCQTVQDRVEAIDSALRSGVQKKAHPDKLPQNIYGTSGEWEEYSTPSRDARLKTTFKELRDLAENLFNLYSARDPRVVYNGSDIKKDMLDSYKAVVAKCAINYTKSDGQKKALTLEQVRSRAFQIGFDPYQCAELRWGATASDEIATCSDDETKRQWYQGESTLRNQIERRYDIRMDYSLNDLLTNKSQIGVANPPDIDVVGYLSH